MGDGSVGGLFVLRDCILRQFLETKTSISRSVARYQKIHTGNTPLCSYRWHCWCGIQLGHSQRFCVVSVDTRFRRSSCYLAYYNRPCKLVDHLGSFDVATTSDATTVSGRRNVTTESVCNRRYAAWPIARRVGDPRGTSSRPLDRQGADGTERPAAVRQRRGQMTASQA